MRLQQAPASLLQARLLSTSLWVFAHGKSAKSGWAIHQINSVQWLAINLRPDAEALDPGSAFLPALRDTGSGAGLILCPALA